MQKTILNPLACRALVAELEHGRNPNMWVYRYTHANGWRFSIATHAEPGSDKLSLGGFRIVPQERSAAPTFDSDVEAIELAIGMEEKVHWSRLLGIGGPLVRRDLGRIVGGKCVLQPSADSRVGEPRDRELLDFAIACMIDCERIARIRIATGQDLGHGLMSDGRTQSLEYLNRGFRGSVVADTSKPTGEGNYYVLLGMLRAFGMAASDATVGLVGAGNIGMHLVDRLRPHGTRMFVLEMRPDRRAELQSLGVQSSSETHKSKFMSEPMDALVLNASGGSLCPPSVEASSSNPRLKVVCGSENLVFVDAAKADLYRARRKAYCPTELGGMMGYLTAAEQYLSGVERKPFSDDALFEAAADLERPAYEATKYMLDHDFSVGFEDAIEATCA